MKKKITLSIICLALSLVMLSACGAKASLFSGSYWLKNSSNFGVLAVNETLEYTVSFEKASGAGVPDVAIDSANSSFKTKLSTSEYNNKRCYLFETALKTVGTVKIGDKSTPLDDSISTKVYFLGVEDELKALYSERVVLSHSVVKRSGNYTVEAYDYTVKTEYSDKTATVDFQPTDACASLFDLKKGKATYDNYNSSAYIDNELLLFAPRAMNLSESFSQGFKSIDALSKANYGITLSAVTDKPTETIDFSTDSTLYHRNNKRVRSVLAYSMRLAKDGSFSGSPLSLYYAAASESDELQCLIKLTTVSTGVGSFTYTIKGAQTDEG